MAIQDKDIGFGESTVVVRTMHKTTRRKIEYSCDCCGGTSIERKFYAAWNVEKQDWEVRDYIDGEDDYCCDCGEEVCSTMQNIPLPGEA